MTEPNPTRRPRALTYTEMMNGGQQQMDIVAYQKELNLQHRKDQQECSVEHLEQSLKAGLESDHGSIEVE